MILEELSQAALFQKVGDICAAVNAVINEDDLLNVSLKQTMGLFRANRGSIFLVGDNDKDLTLKVAFGMQGLEEKSMVKRLGEGIVGKVAESKQPIFVNDIAEDKRFGFFKPRKSYKTPSFICAPLIVKDKLLGVVNISDKESGNRFKEEDMQLLDFLCSQIALNYQRIKLYNKFKVVIKEAESLKNRLGKKDQEAQYLKKQIFIQERLASIGKLAGGIAHEFNNPLDGVMRYTNLCLDHAKEDEVLRGYLLEVKEGLRRMATIVRNLLACSRNDTLSKEKIRFDQALERSLLARKTDIEHKNIKIEKNIDTQIPLLNDLGLERILTNLINNAIDALNDGGRIYIEAKFSNNMLMVSIVDTGTGIKEDDVERIFEPFYTTKDIDKGSGLGLTIVGEIVKNYNGKIDVESRVGQGTRFTVTIPVDNE